MLLRQQLLGAACGAAEQRVEAVVRHPQSRAVVEVLLVEPEAAVFLEVDQVLEDDVGVPRLAVGRESHDLVLA